MDLPTQLAGAKPDLDPYGQLLRMLMPRALGISFYDARGQTLWAADGYDGPDPAPLVAVALARVPPATTGRIDGFSQEHEGAPAYVFRLRGNEGEVIAVVVLLTRDSDNRPFSFVQSLVLPALECLQRELESRASVEGLTRDLQSRDDDLELLLKMAPSDPDSPMAGDELGVLVQTCVDHLGCHLGALVVPERGIAICKAPHGERPQVELLTKIHRHLLNWAQLQRRNLVINKIKVRPIELPPYKILCTPVRHASGRVSGFLAMFRVEGAPNFEPRTERLVELLSRKTTTTLQNNFDQLTSLLTRPAFETQVRGQLAARRQPVPECVLYLDVDRVHVVNDNFGMHVGDEVIGKIAEVLRKKPRPGALAARIAGDRFAVFLPDCTLEFAQQIGEMLRRQCAELTYARGDGTVQVSVSCGAAELPHESQNRLAHGLANAEIACKAAKDRGRNRVEIFQDADQSIMRRSTDIVVVQALHEALAADRFALFAQPILPLNAERTEPRFEFLLRMVSENSELLPPEKFLSAAERYQLLPAIDRWVIRNCDRRARRPGVAAARARDALLDEHHRRLDRLGGIPRVPGGHDPRFGPAAGDPLLRADRDFRGLEPRARRPADAAHLQARLHLRARRFRNRPFLARLPQVAAGLGAEDRRRLRARRRRQPAHRVDGARDRPAGAHHGHGNRRGICRDGRAAHAHGRARRGLRPGLRDRPPGADRPGARRPCPVRSDGPAGFRGRVTAQRCRARHARVPLGP